MELFPPDRLPLVPEHVLREHKVLCHADSRFRACARLLQALHREAAGWAIGTYENAAGRKKKFGHLVGTYDGVSGANFLDLDIHRLARRELAYREPGSMWEEKRLYENLLSSTPLALNLIGPLKLNRDFAEAFVREVAPDLAGKVCSVSFEHSPGRGDATFTEDGMAFDAFFVIRLEDGRRAFLGIEIKYSENCAEPEPRMRPRYDDASNQSELFIEPENPDLRRNPIQQFWRLQLLAQSMIDCGLYDAGRVLVIAPQLNDQVQKAVARYQTHLAPPRADKAGFANLTLEEAVGALALSGMPDHARRLTARYADFGPIHALI